jgi:hypothetical protein
MVLGAEAQVGAIIAGTQAGLIRQHGPVTTWQAEVTMFPTTQGLAKPNRHAEWAAAKKKHAAAIKAKAVAFDEKLGTALDKLSEHEAKMTKAEAAGTLTAGDWRAHLALYKPVATLVTSYRAKVKGLGGPAAADLGGVLDDLAKDQKAWEAAGQKLATARASIEKVQMAAAAVNKSLSNLKTRTPEAHKEITKLLQRYKNTIADPNTLGGSQAIAVQNNGKAVLFELQLVMDKLKAARDAAAAIEKAAGAVAGKAAYEKFKMKAAGLHNNGIGPVADPLRAIAGPNVALTSSIQLNGVKAYAGDFATQNAELLTAMNGLK